MKVSVIYSTCIVKNLKECVQFYRDALGFKEGYHVDLPGGQITIMESMDGASVELIEHPAFPVGMYSIGMDVDNLDEVIKQLDERGFKTLGPIIPTTVGRQAFILDPNGDRICLMEHSEDYKKKYMKK